MNEPTPDSSAKTGMKITPKSKNFLGRQIAKAGKLLFLLVLPSLARHAKRH
ncbi:hypothetical protein [Mesorhizobium sp. IMUNJ 23232]|uniref:hypothetical protein n=1 Tax=Mesorhizobium sp. IMUNJ 23232 TaxID=3376064 RepID=UPI0037ADEFAA